MERKCEHKRIVVCTKEGQLYKTSTLVCENCMEVLDTPPENVMCIINVPHETTLRCMHINTIELKDGRYCPCCGRFMTFMYGDFGGIVIPSEEMSHTEVGIYISDSDKFHTCACGATTKTEVSVHGIKMPLCATCMGNLSIAIIQELI